MKIAIVGAGVIGTTTAHELAEAGHSVTVFEKNGAASESSSFANGGIHSNSFSLPLSTPIQPGNKLSRFWQSTRQMSHFRWASPTNFHWIWSKCSRANSNKQRFSQAFGQQMALLGIDITDTLISHNQWEVEQSKGQLILISDETELNRHSVTLQLLKETGQSHRLLDRDELESVEPALHGADGILKAIYLPEDRVMNCRQFSLLAKQAAQRNGVQFQFETEVSGIKAHTKPQVVFSSGDTQEFDHIVVSTESLLPPEAMKSDLQALTARINSYALSVAIREPLNAPRSAVQDNKTGITISRIGKRLRVCGGAELNRSGSHDHDKRVVNKLFRTLDQYFPGAANYPAGTQIWRGSRTFTLDGLPLVGSAGLPGIWLNLAHGANGWTLATASARLLSQQISGHSTSLPCELISPHRFNR